jgi:hypothetical protein
MARLIINSRFSGPYGAERVFMFIQALAWLDFSNCLEQLRLLNLHKPHGRSWYRTTTAL